MDFNLRRCCDFCSPKVLQNDNLKRKGSWLSEKQKGNSNGAVHSPYKKEMQYEFLKWAPFTNVSQSGDFTGKEG